MQSKWRAHLTRREALVAGVGLAAATLNIDRLALGAAAASAGPGVGIIQGISSFTGGDGSYKRVLREGITIGWDAEEPFAYIDPKTKELDGVDIRIMKRITEVLGMVRGNTISSVFLKRVILSIATGLGRPVLLVMSSIIP